MASTQQNAIPKMAILDDNLSVSAPHFSHIPSSKVSITTFKDTLPPYSHPSTTEEERAALVERLRPFEIISTMRERTPFPAELFRQLPNLKLFLVTGKQHRSFGDYQSTAKEQGVICAAAVGHGRAGAPQQPARLDANGASATTQHTWALILGLARNVAKEDHDMKEGGWQTGFALGTKDSTLGIVGLGRLGAQTARIGVLAFGMKVICWSSSLTQEKADQIAVEQGLPVEHGGEKVFKVVSKEQLFKDSDVVSIHYALSERSLGMVGKAELEAMKETAILVNTSRGPLVDEAALLKTLEKGGIRGAALDVFDIEPLPKKHPFRSHRWGTQGTSDLLISPHMGYVEKEGLDDFYAETAANLERWLDGNELLNRLF
jgi:phosphoglycerate dehydrogenase-like enzyme